MKLVWLFYLCLVNCSLLGHIYLDNCAARVGVANLNLISNSPLTDYYQAGVSNSGISTSISQPFQFSGVENGNITFSKNYHNNHLSVGSLYLLSDYYNLYSNYLSYNYSFQNIITLGISQKFISINETENYFSTITDIGCKITQEKTCLALNYTNLFHKNSSRIDLPNIFSTEISYNPLPETYVAIGFQKEKKHKVSTRFGFRYDLINSLTLLSGYSLEPNQIYFGIGLDYKRVNINYAINTHPQLDSSHYISIIYDM